MAPPSLTSRIAIIGAGPGGLTLANILQRNNFSNIVVYERDLNRSARDQGGSLDLKRETGQEALKRAELFEKFRALARVEGEELKIADKNAKVYLHDASPAVDDDGLSHNPEIERSELRDILLDGLAPGTVKWNHNVQDIETSDGVSTIKFADETTAEVDLVIGADGAWSKIRPLFEGAAEPEYSGITFIDMTIPDFDKRYPRHVPLIGHGMFIALSDSKSIFAQRNANGVVRIYAALSVLEDWHKTSDLATATDPNVQKQLLLEFYDGWATSLRQLIEYCDPKSLVVRPIYALPVGHSWKTRPGFTLVGDAAHLMSPFAGEGVNTAMADASDLAAKLIEGIEKETDLSVVVEVYEKEMFVRAGEVTQESANNLKLFFNSNAPKDLVNIFLSMGLPAAADGGVDGGKTGSFFDKAKKILAWVFNR
ncbi:monooxygenase [Cladochytrium replicatum]|nr:monooxygenase [Cladochytrium replicatum]